MTLANILRLDRIVTTRVSALIVQRYRATEGNEMTTQSSHPILVTGAAGAVGSIGRN
jgi:hypothetical protein